MTIHSRKKTMPLRKPPVPRTTVRVTSKRQKTELTFEKEAQAYLWRTGRGLMGVNRN